MFFLFIICIFFFILVPIFEGQCTLAELPVDSEMLVEYKSERPYRNNADCTLTFKCPSNENVIGDFSEFDLDPVNCEDFVSVDGTHYCESTVPVIDTQKSFIEIHFHSDQFSTANGFKMNLGCKGIQFC